jgi:glycosyltransferase involved in cell wall biosynthesis
MRVALLLSTLYFEDFYGKSLGLTREQYLDAYRNDWSWDWCQMLAHENVDASIYVPTIEDADRVRTPDGYSVRFLPLGAAALPWVRFPVLSRTPVGRYVGQAANAAAFLRPLRTALAEDGIDVLCVQEYWTARFDVLARAVTGPVVALDQGLPDRREIKLLKRGAFGRTRGTVVQTQQQAEKVGRYGAIAERIPNAVDTSLFSPGGHADTEHPTILCVGRLHDAQKRLSDVLRALALLPPSWRLEIAGSGPDRDMLERLAAELGISDRVSYLGFVARGSELRDLYRRAAVLALPSAYEGLPMVLLEAMSCGTPVVGSDIAAISEVIDNERTGLLVPVGNPERLAGALRAAVTRRNALGAAARDEILAHYDQTVVAPRLDATLQAAAQTPANTAEPLAA